MYLSWIFLLLALGTGCLTFYDGYVASWARHRWSQGKIVVEFILFCAYAGYFYRIRVREMRPKNSLPIFFGRLFLGSCLLTFPMGFPFVFGVLLEDVGFEVSGTGACLLTAALLGIYSLFPSLASPQRAILAPRDSLSQEDTME